MWYVPSNVFNVSKPKWITNSTKSDSVAYWSVLRLGQVKTKEYWEKKWLRCVRLIIGRSCQISLHVLCCIFLSHLLLLSAVKDTQPPAKLVDKEQTFIKTNKASTFMYNDPLWWNLLNFFCNVWSSVVTSIPWSPDWSLCTLTIFFRLLLVNQIHNKRRLWS